MTLSTRLRAKLRRARSLPVLEWLLFVAAWSLLLVAELSLWILPLPALLKYLRRIPSPVSKAFEAEHLALLVEMAARNHILRRRCLRTALVWKSLLPNNNDTKLVVGVARLEGGFAAHAWVEYRGQPLGEGERGYQPLVVL